MDIRIRVHYSYILLLSFLFLLPETSNIMKLLRFLAACALFYFLPGVFLARRFLGKCNLFSSIAVSILVGICFHIVYVYFLSLFEIAFNLYLLLIPTVVFAVLADYFAVRLPPIDKKEFYLLLAGLVFFLLTCTITLGEDGSGHLYFADIIRSQRLLSKTYPLYPELFLSYHMGFDVINGEFEYITNVRTLLPVTSSLFCILLMWSSYVCVWNLHSKKAGLIAGILVVFAVIPPLYYLSYGAYASITAFAIQPLVIFVVYNSNAGKPYLLPLVLAAGVMSHSSFVLFWIPLLALMKFKILIPSFAASIILSVPYLVRIQPGYSAQEIAQFYHMWYTVEAFRIEMLAVRIGSFILICGVLGLLFVKRNVLIFFSVWLLSLLLLALTTLLPEKYPFWYVFFANRLVDMMFIPLALLSGIFAAEILKNKHYILIALLILPMVSHFYYIPRSPSPFLDDSPEFTADLEGIQWLSENTEESTIILNDWWTGTGSAWITVLARRRVIFPFLYVHDHFLDKLDIPERGRDVFWIGLAPDTVESHKLLQEWGVDFIFLSSHVEDRVKWRRNLWNVEKMVESPNYELVFNENDTYIFRVKEEWVYTYLHVLKEIEGELNEPIHIPDVEESFPVNKVIRIIYKDTGTALVKFWSDRGLLAEIPLLNTGSQTTVVLPFTPFLFIESSEPFCIVSIELVADLPCSDHGSLHLLGWEFS